MYRARSLTYHARSLTYHARLLTYNARSLPYYALSLTYHARLLTHWNIPVANVIVTSIAMCAPRAQLVYVDSQASQYAFDEASEGV